MIRNGKNALHLARQPNKEHTKTRLKKLSIVILRLVLALCNVKGFGRTEILPLATLEKALIRPFQFYPLASVDISGQ
jgi:hypothetical protein